MSRAPKNNWRPSASIEQLKIRAQLLQQLRSFFAERKVMEVSTPVLASAGVTDPFVDNFSLEYEFSASAKSQPLYLQTSPEYAMKRLLAAGCEHIYQIGPAFRHEDSGRFHNPEFCLLEWYRSGFSMHDLIEEVADLLKHMLQLSHVQTISYQQVFIQYLDIDPLVCTKCELLNKLAVQGIQMYSESEHLDNDDVLQLLFSEAIEPHFANNHPVIVYHFPASQAALATLCEQDKRIANRFEAYYQGIELANGFHELTDANEQRRRFEQDNIKRESLGKPHMPIDEKFVQALESGLPACAGVALGVDRLHMLVAGISSISEVLSFDNKAI